MSGNVELAIGLILIAACLGAAVIRPFGISEAVVAVPAVAVALLAGVATTQQARSSLRELAPTVAFLAAILAFGHLCASAGVFAYLGSVTAHLSNGSPGRLLGLVVALAAVVTATLTLDATVVLVTPVVLATTARLAIPSRPHSYACAHIANSGSLLLPVSNLTNLLAFAASGLSFGRFAAAMSLPWLVACGLNWSALRLAFGADLRTEPREQLPVRPAPHYALVVLGATITGFVVTTAAGIAPAWAAAAGCAALAIPLFRRRKLTVSALIGETNPGFCLFVLSLGVLVSGLLTHGVDGWLRHLIPGGTGLASLLGLAALAAVLANLVNNLPSTLALVPLVADHPLAVLAVLIGVNLGPNATYPGSLATLLWRRTLPAAERPKAVEFYRLGLTMTPVLLGAATVTLWLVSGPLGIK
jgi:arsenical pump membrane protein